MAKITFRCFAVGWLFAAGSLVSAAPVELYVAPNGADTNPGTVEKPFRTLYRAQEAVCRAVEAMDGDIVVNLAPGQYRLDRTLEFTEADSGRDGFRVVYRSAAGPGRARVLGSVALVGWQKHRDGIFLDWPKMCMHQVFRNVHIVRPQGRQLRSHGPDNGASAKTENVSWEPDFDESRMEYDSNNTTSIPRSVLTEFLLCGAWVS